jgi:hypothetical protein
MIANKLGLERKIKPYFFLTLLVGSIAQLAIIFPSGLFRRGGYQFWGVQFHDALWHVSVAQKIKDFSFENPVYAGEIIRNYHYLTNLIIAFVSKITGISLFHVTYRILPLFVTTAIGILTFVLVNKVFKNQKAAVWSMFFAYLGSNLAYILPLFGLGFVIWETTMWVQQPLSVFSNLPFATSIPFVLMAMICLKLYLEKNSRNYFIYSIILFAVLPSFKSHSVVFLLALGVVGIWRVITKRRLDILFLSLITTMLAYIIISPTFHFEKHLIFEPGWYLRTMIEAPDRLNWQDWALRYQFYKAHYDIFNLARFYAVAFLIFFIGNLGTRLVSILGIPNVRKLMADEINLLLIVSAIIFAVIPMLFLTTGVAWNSIQFFYYFLLITGIYSGVGMSKVIDKIKKNKLKWAIAVIVILLTIPVDIYTLWFFYSKPPDSMIRGARLEALQKLSEVGSNKDVVLNLPAGSNNVEIAAFTGKSMFLGDWLQAIVPGHDYQGRLDILNKAMEKDEDFVEFLDKYGIDWIYIGGDNPQIIKDTEHKLSEFYISDKIKIYHVEEN